MSRKRTNSHDVHLTYHFQSSDTFGHGLTASCAQGFGICIALRLGQIIVSDWNVCRLLIYSLTDGSLVRHIGCRGSGKEQFNANCGGLSVSPDGDSVLVAEYGNHRVQEVRVADGSWVRFVGEGLLRCPQYVDCNADVIVVSEHCDRISVLSWRTGDLVSQFGSYGSGPDQLKFPSGVRLLRHNRLVVADSWNDRLCMFTTNGEFVKAMGSREQGLKYPRDVVEWRSSLVVAHNWDRDLVRLSAVTVEALSVLVETMAEIVLPKFRHPPALGALPDGGLVVRDYERIHVLYGHALRVAWLSACVMSE